MKRQGIIRIVAIIVSPFSLQIFKVVAENNLIAAYRLVWIFLKKKAYGFFYVILNTPYRHICLVNDHFPSRSLLPESCGHAA